MAGIEDTETSRKHYHAPYTDRNPIPTIQHYKEVKEQRKENALPVEDDGASDAQPGRAQQTIDAYKDWRDGKRQDNQEESKDKREAGEPDYQDSSRSHDQQGGGDEHDEHVVEDTSEVQAAQDPKERRKTMKKRDDDRADREVTDPVTHLPVKIHDFTKKDLKDAPENEPTPGSSHRTATGLSQAANAKSTDNLNRETKEMDGIHAGMRNLFPPPEFDDVRRDISHVYRTAIIAGLGVVLSVAVGLLLLEKVFDISARIESLILRKDSSGKSLSGLFLVLVGGALGSLVVWTLATWTDKKIGQIWESHVWESERHQHKEMEKSSSPETVQWLNSLFSNVWPIVNPDLFTSLADMLEDVMQASLPKLVRMVSVEDIGQGSESIRILGIKWLPTGAATKSVTEDGKLEENKKKKNDRTVSGEGSIDRSSKDDDDSQDDGDDNGKNSSKKQQKEQTAQNVAEGMEAEEGDFVNMEIAFAYRARTAGKTMKNRVKNAHLYLAFYLPSNIKIRKLFLSQSVAILLINSSRLG